MPKLQGHRCYPKSSTHLAMITTQTVTLAVADHEPVLASGQAKAPDEVVVVFV